MQLAWKRRCFWGWRGRLSVKLLRQELQHDHKQTSTFSDFTTKREREQIPAMLSCTMKTFLYCRYDLLRKITAQRAPKNGHGGRFSHSLIMGFPTSLNDLIRPRVFIFIFLFSAFHIGHPKLIRICAFRQESLHNGITVP